jgi:histidyl-tRNA synthetase
VCLTRLPAQREKELMQTLPGFRDFLPADCASRNYTFDTWRRVARGYGFVEWDGPVLEPTEIYRKKSGPEIVDQLFNFVDKGEREVAMRPELTPTLARVVAANERSFKKPLKWFSIGQFFRYEKQQRGRLREHFQLNCDILGEAGPAADVEMVALCVDVLRGFGLTEKDFVVRISDRGFWTEFLEQKNVPPEEWQAILQAIDKSEREPREKTAVKLGPLADAVFEVFDGGGRSQRLDEVVTALGARGLGEFVEVDVQIVRGLAYYTGVVFEAFDRAGKLRAIAGGGRYDNLVQQLSEGAVSMPALGFAMGDVVLGELIKSVQAASEKMSRAVEAYGNLDAFVIIAKEDRRSDALLIVQRFRENGLRVDYSFGATKIPKQFQAAENLGARVALIFGDEWPQIAAKDLRSGKQELVGQDELLSRLKAMLQ